MSAIQRSGLHAGQDFNENSPRPPVPGEETEVVGPHSPVSASFHTHSSTWSGIHKLYKGESPVLTPRRSSLTAGSHRSNVADPGAPLGFEPEGSCGGGDRGGRYHHEQPASGPGLHSPPPYLRWARNLHDLLQDPDGVQLFRRYLEQEGRPHADTLDFWFACEGLKKQSDLERITQLVKVIYRRFFLKTQLAIPDDLRKDVTKRIKEGREVLYQGVFDAVQAEVEHLINQTTYPNFLKSDLYLQHVQAMQNGPSAGGESASSSGSSSSRELPGLGAGGLLPTLHEESELTSTSLPASMSASMAQPAHGEAPLRLTRDMLMATQKRRATELKPKPEAYAGIYLQRPYHSHMPFLSQSYTSNPHMIYNSYNPVSRQDSELQSLSSDARTESDNMSLTDSSVDGMSISRTRSSRRQHVKYCRQMKESANLNRDPYMHRTVIPRTQLMQKEQAHPMKPEHFAAILIEKLESVRREQDAQEKLDRKLQENDMGCEEGIISMEGAAGDTAVSSRALADALREKLMVEDDSDQAILDQHVSRVWSDLTPSRSPGFDSPRPKSPDGRRRITARQGYSSRHARKDKDVFSTFSSDSGNVHDYMDDHNKHHVPKSRSVPDYVETLKQDSLTSHDPRFRQGRETCRRSTSSRKTLTDQTDSGVSVVSDTPPVMPTQLKDSKVLSWLLDSEKQQVSTSEGSWHSRSERESSSSSKHRVRATSATSPSTSRHSRKPGIAHHSGSRSGSLERGVSVGVSMSGMVGPAQPFVADPSMPPLPQPHTATQLEEARRRLMDETLRQRPRYSISGKEAPHSNPSTLRRNGRSSSGRPVGTSDPHTAPPQEFTTVVFTFCEEQFPYRTKISGLPVTLRQFKEILPKKGNYRYFFKTECEELDVKVIQEEVTDDSEILPLWEGKIMAQVRPVD